MSTKPITIKIERTPGEDFFSDLLITAFDGDYGSSWNWFEPAGGGWLQTDEEDHWMSAHIRLRREYRDDKGVRPLTAKRSDGWFIDHEALAAGIQRILDDDYVDIWRPANAHEVAMILDKFGSGTSEGEIYGRSFRLGRTFTATKQYEVETGETARGYRAALAQIMSYPDPDSGDIDAPFADAIVQVASFGKCIFS